MDELRMSNKQWQELKNALSDIVPYYDCTNAAITFGMDEGWRETASRESRDRDVALEIGSGPGTLAVKLRSGKVICLDPLMEMHKAAKNRISAHGRLDRFRFLAGCAEEIPIADEQIDIVYCAFSFRDFRDKRRGLEEIYRVLKPGGKLVVLDIAKTDRIKNSIIHAYIEKIAPLIAPKSKNSMKWLAKTYLVFGGPRYYSKLIWEIGFSKTNTRFLSFGIAFMLVAEK